MKYLFIATFILCACSPHLVFRTSPKGKPYIPPKLYISIRYDNTRYVDTGSGKERQFKLTNDSLVWIDSEKHLFPGDLFK